MKAKERIERYGIAAYIKMRGIKPSPQWKYFYKAKYPEAPVELDITHPEISKRQKRYWQKVKALSKGRDMSIKEARTFFKGERKEGRIRLIKQGEGYQLYMNGLYENEKTGEIDLESGKVKVGTRDRAEAEGWSKVRKQKMLEASFNECVRYAQATLGGSNWKIVKVLKKEWYRFIGREKSSKKNDKEE